MKTQEDVDFMIHLGVGKEEAEKFLGTHWTLKLWKDGDVWGGHFTCQELPHMNSVQTLVEGVSKTIDDPLWGGKATIVFKQTSDTEFVTTINSEKFGHVTLTETYCDEGSKHVLSGKGKSVTSHWVKQVKFEGAYRFDKGENVEAFNTASGYSELNKVYKDYKLYFVRKNGRIHMAEFFGSLGKAYNSFVLDEETHFRVPGDCNKSDGSHRVIVTCTGTNKRMMVIKGPKGSVQEWEMIFTDCGLTLHGFDKDSNSKCTYHLKRFVEMSGPWKKLSITGFEKFGQALGIPCSRIQALTTDTSSIFEIHDLGNGVYRHKISNKHYCTEYSFKLNEEFTYKHPLLNEDVKAVCTFQCNVLTMTVNTSKGLFKSCMTFNDTFLVTSVCSPALGLGYKVVLMRSCCM